MALRLILLGLIQDQRYQSIKYTQFSGAQGGGQIQALAGAQDVIVSQLMNDPLEFSVVKGNTMTLLTGHNAVLLHLGLPPVPTPKDTKAVVIDYLTKFYAKDAAGNPENIGDDE